VRGVSRALAYGTHDFVINFEYCVQDMFEGRARALSGSLDREAQWLRMAASTPTPRIPTATVRSWAAQLLLALEAIHRWGIIIG